MSVADRKRVRHQRAIPDEFFPLVEQGMLNMVFNGGRVIDQHGADVSDSLRAKAKDINSRYEAALTKLRLKRAITRKADTHTEAPRHLAKPGPKK